MMSKTRTDKLFEAYLKNKNIPFIYEPYSSVAKNPDYLLDTSIGTILVEVKEILLSPILSFKARAVVDGRSIMYQKNLYRKLRDEIYKASKQIKPHIDRADYAVVVFGFHYEFDQINISDFLAALKGDPFLKLEHKTEVENISKPTAALSYSINGALRKRDRMHCRYISAFGMIKDKRLFESGPSKFASSELLSMYNNISNRGKTIKEIMKLISERWNDSFGCVQDSDIELELINYKSGNNSLVGDFDKLCKYKI